MSAIDLHLFRQVDRNPKTGIALRERDIAAMVANDRSCDCEAQTDTAGLAVSRSLKAKEGSEDFLVHRLRIPGPLSSTTISTERSPFFTRRWTSTRRTPTHERSWNVCVLLSIGRAAVRRIAFRRQGFERSLPGSLHADCLVLTDAALKAFLISLIRWSRVL